MSVDRGDALFWEGDEAEHYYQVISGAIRFCKIMPDGRRQVASFYLPGDLIGIEAADKYRFSAEAVIDSVVVRFPKSRVEAAAAEDPKVGQALLTIALDRLTAAQNQMLLLGRMNATERVASFLLALASRVQLRDTMPRIVDITMSRTDIADYLGLTIETVSRAFAKLKKDRVIDLPHPQQAIVLDLARLEQLSEGAA